MASIKAPLQYRTCGFIHNLIIESEHTIIYSKSNSDPKLPPYTSYEVFEKRISSNRYVKGNFLRAHVTIPADEDFGKWAWCYYTFKQALKRFNILED